MNPIVRMMKRYIKMPLKYALPLLFIGALVLASTTGCTSSSSPTATPTAQKATVAATATANASTTPAVKATTKPTATPVPTVPPTLSSFHGLLLEHPASVSGDDLSGHINEEIEIWYTLVTPYHRATIDGRDVYIGTMEDDRGVVEKTYIFPLGSYSEGRAAQAAYVKQFQSKGFIISRESTTNSKEESMIWTDNGAEEVDFQVLGFNTVLGDTAMTIYIPEQTGYPIS